MNAETLKKANALTSKIEDASEFLSALSNATFGDRKPSIKVQADTYKSADMHLDREVVNEITPGIRKLISKWQAEIDAL